MPGWLVHDFVDRTLFNRSYRKIHRKMDEPFIYLGKGHRVLFHDFAWAYVIARDCYPYDENAVLAAGYHILIDELCTQDPGYRRFLEKLATVDKAERRRRKKTTKQISTKEDPFLIDLKRLSELKRLIDYFSARAHKHA